MATVQSTEVVNPGTASITVFNPSPEGGSSNVVFLQVTNPVSGVSISRHDLSEPYTSFVIVADVNNDGKPDIAAANPINNSISISIGNGDGTFQPPVQYGTASYPGWIAAGDFNHDGKVDLVVVCSGNGLGNLTSVLLGNGDGSFQTHIDYGVGPDPQSVVTGDFNGDGNLDIAVSSPTAGTLSVLLGNGDGTFQIKQDFNAGPVPYSVITGDFNRDGKLDLVVANNYENAGSVSVLLGNGDGTFQAPVEYPTAALPDTVVAGDFDGDGTLDLAVGIQGGSTPAVSILLGNGDGTFRPGSTYPMNGLPQSLALGDFNSDGKLDVATVNVVEQDTLSILLGNGDGTFQSPMDYPAQPQPESLAIGDFNGDGRLDLASADLGDISIFLQGPAVSLSPTSLTFPTQVVATTSAPRDVVLANVGVSALTISSIKITGTNKSDFAQTNTCAASIPPGGSCTISVTFTPTLIGTRTAFVSIADNATASPQKVKVTGVGTYVQLNPGKLSFGNQPVGTTSSARKVIVTNKGATVVKITSINVTGTNASDFAETSTCGTSLASGASCKIVVTFTPSVKGKRTANLAITDNGGGSPQLVALSGTGT
jgi:hypothetical protein